MQRVLIFFFGATLIMVAMAFVAQNVVQNGRTLGGTITPVAHASKSHGPSAYSVEQSEGGARTVINRDDNGQFHLTALVNGHETPFMIDTGADFVALSVASAQEAGLTVDPTTFQPITRTASGTGNGAIYTVEELEVAGKTFRNMQVVVLDGLQTNLLGQSALGKIGRVELQGDRMVIETD